MSHEDQTRDAMLRHAGACLDMLMTYGAQQGLSPEQMLFLSRLLHDSMRLAMEDLQRYRAMHPEGAAPEGAA